jgi:tripartite-type tricarboxylate transporter receptor subunit TctC
MKSFARRGFLQLGAAGTALSLLPRQTLAQAYPSRPVRILVGFPAGGNGDILARLIGQWLSERLSVPFVIENRPGAGGNIATEIALRSDPDGYTLLFAGSTHTINASLYQNLNFNFVRDSVGIASLIQVPNVFECHPSFPAKSVAEFIDYAKANPDKISMASAGIGTPNHLCGELFQFMTGVKMSHVPYRGSAPMLTDLVAGHVSVAFDPLPTSIEYLRAGTLRAFGVTTATRVAALPDVPCITDTVPGYEMQSFFGLVAPAGTPSVIVSRLNDEINKGLVDATLKARLADLGGTPLILKPDAFAKLLSDETDKMAKIVKLSGAKVE